jgi:hypothetical protein
VPFQTTSVEVEVEEKQHVLSTIVPPDWASTNFGIDRYLEAISFIRNANT